MSKNKEVSLNKKPIWFLFLGANVLILLGCAITMMLYSSGDVGLIYLPTLICDLLALAAAGVFGYFEVKDFAPQIMHFQRKWLKFYVAALSTFIAAVLFNVLYFLFFLNKLTPIYLKQNILGWEVWVYFGITAFLSLVSIGLQRYARFRIDLDVYRRKHGQNPNEPKDPSKDSVDTKKPDQKSKRFDDKKSNKPKASSGLLDQM